jgi:hypothetical protein
MSSNKTAKQELIKLYGAECFIERLHLRHDQNRHYTSRGQLKRMKQLTYHHIKMKKDGGKATVSNGALLSAENHQWFHKQNLTRQAEMNKQFQLLKQREDYKRVGIVFEDEIDTGIELNTVEISLSPNLEVKPVKQKFNRAKEKQELNRLKQEYEDR